MLQRSPEWYAAKLGKVSASRISEMIAKTKTGAWGASRANYMAELTLERLTGLTAESYVSPAMQWGIDTEPRAREVYEWMHNCTTEHVGFCDHPTIGMSGASPDGFVGAEGGVEFKCPNSATHIDTLINQAVPREYRLQMQWGMACTKRKWCDWVSFDPRLPSEMQMFIKRVPRDPAEIAELEKQTGIFLEDLEERLAHLRALYPKAREAAE